MYAYVCNLVRRGGECSYVCTEENMPGSCSVHTHETCSVLPCYLLHIRLCTRTYSVWKKNIALDYNTYCTSFSKVRHFYVNGASTSTNN